MKTVLVVEDEKMIRKGICSMIKRCGVPVEMLLECSSGQMALDILREQQVDVMFTDIRMPRMDGIELVERMQELPNPPLTVVISGYDDFSYAIQMMRNGVREYMLKPVEREQIAKIMKQMEQELEARRRVRIHLEHMEFQQLRYQMLAEYGEDFQEKSPEVEILPETYVAACFEKREMEIERDQVFLTGEAGGFFTILAEPGQMEYLCRDELRKCCLGISACHSGAKELHSAYLEACAARREAFGSGSHVVRFREAEPVKPGEPDAEGMEQIAHMLGTDKGEDALFRLERMASEVRNGKMPVILFEENMRLLLEKIRVLYKNVIEDDEKLEELIKIYHYCDITSYMNALKEWCGRFSERMKDEFENFGEKQKLQQALAYIQKNFSGDLNMATVSNYVSMNYSMFSSAFKSYTGMNFVSYLKNLRINEAKRLLVETDLRIAEISQRAGYDNEKHFMKTFKSLCGVSPTEFRRNSMYGENTDTGANG